MYVLQVCNGFQLLNYFRFLRALKPTYKTSFGFILMVKIMTNYEWSSILESVAAGVPMATWPLYEEQFLKKKLVTDALRLGVGVGALEYGLDGWMRKDLS